MYRLAIIHLAPIMIYKRAIKITIIATYQEMKTKIMFQTNIAKTKTVHRVDWKTLTATKLQANIIPLFLKYEK